MKRAFFTAILTALFVTPALAATFASMDTDKNSQVTWEEFQASHPNMLRPAFDMVDANKDGMLTKDEWSAFRGNHGKEGKGMDMSKMMKMKKGKAPHGTMHKQHKPLIAPPSGE